MEIVGEIVAIVVGFGLLALICKVVGEHIGKKRDEKIEQNQPIEIQQKPKITIHYKDRPAVPPLELARNMLVSYYMDMGEDTTKSVGMETKPSDSSRVSESISFAFFFKDITAFLY